MITLPFSNFSTQSLKIPNKFPSTIPKSPFLLPKKALTLAVKTASSKSSSEPQPELSSAPEEDEWLKKLPEKNKPLYSHSLPCIEAWMRKLGFYRSKEDRAVWFIELPEWHAQLSLDVTDLYVSYQFRTPTRLSYFELYSIRPSTN